MSYLLSGPFHALQIIFIKGLVTLGKSKWLLSLVGPIMPLQMIFFLIKALSHLEQAYGFST